MRRPIDYIHAQFICLLRSILGNPNASKRVYESLAEAPSSDKEQRASHTPGFHIELEDGIRQSLEEYAMEFGLSPHDALRQWIRQQANQQKNEKLLWERWLSLTPREQQVVALFCLGLADHEIAERLPNIRSANTVKAHLTSALRKFKVRSREQLKIVLGEWDFSKFDIDFPR